VTPALQAVLATYLESALAVHRTDLGNIHVVDPTGALVIVAQRGFGEAFLNHFRIVRQRENSACARAMRGRAPVVIEDVDADPLFAPHREIAAASGFRAVQSTPLMSRRGSMLGVLSTHFRTPRAFSARELDMTMRHAQRIAAAIERAPTG
jgi:GAF domain-containing protein